MLSAKTVSNTSEFQQILRLQQQNLRQNVSEEEKQEQGFVTMEFTLPMLEAMHALAPSVIVKDDDKVIGYAIVFMPGGRELYPSLEPMFALFDTLTWKGKPLDSYRFYVMGQICIDKPYRGKGVFEMLYRQHKELYQHEFDFVLTEISVSNHRSVKAHEKVGFATIHHYKDVLDDWLIVLWDWR